MELPVISSCDLDSDGLRAQLERYRAAGRGAEVIERSPRLLAIEVEAEGAAVVPALIEVESECCPFFGLDWDPESRRLSISVTEERDEPALGAIAYALGVPQAKAKS